MGEDDGIEGHPSSPHAHPLTKHSWQGCVSVLGRSATPEPEGEADDHMIENSHD